MSPAHVSYYIWKHLMSKVQICCPTPQLLDAAEAKAYWGLAKNYGALEALVAALIEQETLSGAELADVIEKVRTHPCIVHVLIWADVQSDCWSAMAAIAAPVSTLCCDVWSTIQCVHCQASCVLTCLTMSPWRS